MLLFQEVGLPLGLLEQQSELSWVEVEHHRRREVPPRQVYRLVASRRQSVEEFVGGHHPLHRATCLLA